MLERIGFNVSFNPSMASHRYRVLHPMRELSRMGYPVSIGMGDITVFSKHGGTNLRDMESLYKRGLPIIYDMCDDHLESTRTQECGLQLGMATKVIASTEYLQRRLKEYKGIDSTVISEAYEYPLREPKFRNEGMNILFYGHASNLPSLSCMKFDFSANMAILSNFPTADVQWNPYNLLCAFEWADIVILPSDTRERKAGTDMPNPLAKGPIRLVEAVRMGKYVVASPELEAYAPYGMFRGEIGDGIRWVRANPEEALDQVRKAQSIVNDLHSPDRIGQQWREACYGSEPRRDLRGT